MSSVQLGINPLSWSNDDMMSLGESTPLETCLAESRQAGYTGIELGNKFSRDPEILQAILQEFNLRLISGWYSARLLERTVEEELEAIQPHLQLLKKMGCRVMVYCEISHSIHGDITKPLSNRPQMIEAEWDCFLFGLNQIADHLASAGVFMAYHHHMGTVIQSEDDVHRLLEGTGKNVGLLLDTGHMTYEGGNHLDIINRWGQRINHVHCKDIRTGVYQDACNRDLSFLQTVLDGSFTVPGDGCLDYMALTRQLKEKSYSGWIVVEADQDPSVAHPLTYAIKGYDHLYRCIDETGL